LELVFQPATLPVTLKKRTPASNLVYGVFDDFSNP